MHLSAEADDWEFEPEVLRQQRVIVHAAVAGLQFLGQLNEFLGRDPETLQRTRASVPSKRDIKYDQLKPNPVVLLACIMHMCVHY